MWWHVCGVAAITAILVFVPQHHAGVSEVFTQRIDNTGFFGGHAFGTGFLFLVLPLSAIFPQFTVTGYDASCHMSEETVGASDSAARGIWQAILYSGIGGWFLLLSEKFRAVLSLDKAWNAVQWLLTASGIVLGGTAIDGEGNLAPDDKAPADILVRCAEVEPRLVQARLLEHRIGARPTRATVRVEKDLGGGRHPG
ncbi:hypothetical protein [Streptomyces sp. NPDC048192]|uniref:hypothetical protein n=1 Tax=Streptomyces sp. NPDC048192 TaxID=3365510 RepID=UPI0037138D69